MKVKYDKKTMEDGLQQTAQYMKINNATKGHLVIFDRSLKKSCDEKIYTHQRIAGGYPIVVWGM